MEPQFEALLEAAPDAMVVSDPRGDIVWVNAQTERLFGRSRADLVGQSVETLVPPQLRTAHRAHRVAYQAQPSTRPMGSGLTLAGQRRDGTEFPVEISLSPLKVEGMVLTIAAIRDVTARQQAQREREQLLLRERAAREVAEGALLREQAAREVAEGALLREQQARAEAEEAVLVRDQVLAMVTHDLKNPVTALSGSIQHLQRQSSKSGPLDEKRLDKTLASMASVTARMRSLLDELLDGAQLQQGQLLDLDRRPTDLVGQVQAAVSAYSHLSDHHRVRCVTSVPALVGTWDASRLDRVLANLLANAVKYSPGGGEVAVLVAREEALEGPVAVLVVRDQGIGIPAADVGHVFELFFRGSNVVGRVQGTGIGLRTSRQIVEQHGGTITLESKEGVGTTVTVRLPLSYAARQVA